MNHKITRREWNTLALAGLGTLLLPASLTAYAGEKPSASKIQLGVQTYSFRDRSLDDAILAMRQLGITSCELWEGHVSPRELQWAAGQTPETAKTKAEALKKWRDNLDMAQIRAIKAKLDAAGISIVALTATIKDNTDDSEIDLFFRIALALGTSTINSSATVSVMKRIDPFAQKYQVKVAMHNHAHVDRPNEISSPDSFARGMSGLSEYICINLDIGHFTAANFDAVDFLRQHHQKILSIHLKDRKKNQGPNMPFGEGDTPIGSVLTLIRDNQWPIPANIEYEYPGGDTVAEVKKCLEFCKKALA